MIVKDDALLSKFRYAPCCELCGRRVVPLDAHHAYVSRGCGGGTRLDVEENLASLDRLCHGKAHASTETADEVRAIVAKRHGLTVEQIRDWLWLVLRTDKGKPIPRRPWSKRTA